MGRCGDDMIANEKRYKNTIKEVKKLVWDNYADDSITLSKRIYFVSSVYDMSLWFNAKVDCSKRQIVYENLDGTVYIGIDLADIKFGYDLANLMSEVYTTKIEWRDPDIMTRDQFFKDSQYDFYALQSNHSNITKIPGYAKLRARIIEVNDSLKADVTLDKKQFPTLKKRDMLPVAWIDFDKGQVLSTTNNYSGSYRKDIQVANLAGISDQAFIKTIRACSRLLTIDFDYKNKPTGL